MMKNIAFKLSLTLIVFALFCPIVFAENTPNNTPFDINTFSDTINAEDLVYLSYESLKELNVQLLIFAQNHNYDENAIDNQLKVLLNHYRNEISENKLNKTPSQGKLNSAERALVLKYPSQAPAYLEVSANAILEAEARYTENSCWWSGNGDAFRHVYWNASLMKRYYDLFGWNVDQCAAVTKTWTDAHEEDGEAWDVHHEMDMLNNYAGRNIGYSYYKKSEIEILNESQRYVDLGFCKRVDQRSGDVNPKLYPTDTSEKR